MSLALAPIINHHLWTLYSFLNVSELAGVVSLTTNRPCNVAMIRHPTFSMCCGKLVDSCLLRNSVGNELYIIVFRGESRIYGFAGTDNNIYNLVAGEWRTHSSWLNFWLPAISSCQPSPAPGSEPFPDVKSQPFPAPSHFRLPAIPGSQLFPNPSHSRGSRPFLALPQPS